MHFFMSVTSTHQYKVPINLVDVSVFLISLQDFGSPSHPRLIPPLDQHISRFQPPFCEAPLSSPGTHHTPSTLYVYTEELCLESPRTDPQKLLNRRPLAQLIYHKCCRKRWLTFSRSLRNELYYSGSNPFFPFSWHHSQRRSS